MGNRSAFALLLALGVFLALALPVAAAEEHGLKLLAVSDDGDTGLTANLYLRLSPGTGNVFIESEPLTKLDTKFSLKVAKEIACESLAMTSRCNEHDFFFRLEANASLIGGPSAGAAAAALVIAAVNDSPINQSVAVTGTINSGGLIGHVGGLKEKIDAAKASGLSRVLIPAGERFAVSQDRKALDLLDYGQLIGVEVVEVDLLEDVLTQLTGRNYVVEEATLEISWEYEDIMRELADELCSRSLELESQISRIDTEAVDILQQNAKTGPQPTAAGVIGIGKDLVEKGIVEKEQERLYSAASMCFGANVRYSYLLLLDRNLSVEDALTELNRTNEEISRFARGIPEPRTLADLQVRGTVNERLEEARQLLTLARQDLETDKYADAIYRIAFARERIGGAAAWNRFLTEGPANSDSASVFDRSSLRNGCVARLQEAEENIDYLDIYLPGVLRASDELGLVYDYVREADYASCIYTASLAKAKANAMLSALGANENLSRLVDNKLQAAKRSITRQTGKGDFPIISYSYYEYAHSLGDDPPSALLFAEYALELSNLRIYLASPGSIVVPEPQPQPNAGHPFASLAAAALAGFAAGILVVGLIVVLKKRLPGRKKSILVRRRS